MTDWPRPTDTNEVTLPIIYVHYFWRVIVQDLTTKSFMLNKGFPQKDARFLFIDIPDLKTEGGSVFFRGLFPIIFFEACL